MTTENLITISEEALVNMLFDACDDVAIALNEDDAPDIVVPVIASYAARVTSFIFREMMAGKPEEYAAALLKEVDSKRCAELEKRKQAGKH